MTTPKYPARRSSVAAYLEQAIEHSGLAQTEIAEALGYDQPNIISMFKTGRTKVPIEIIPKLAELLGVSELYFLKLAMEEYHPEMWKVIERAFGKLVSDNEYDIVDCIRTASTGTDPELTEDVEKELFRLFAPSSSA
jgi:transcriptional regulator with XRE-family HTH domain